MLDHEPHGPSPFRLSKFQTCHLFVLMFNIACFVSFTRLSWVVGRQNYTSIEFILGTLGAIGFPIGMGLLNRGGFFTMVFSFAVSVVVAVLTYSLSRIGF